jgi:hypothetical protein
MIAIRLMALAGTLGAASLALAQTSGAIHACVNSKSGAIRIVQAVAACSSKESPLSWNAEARAQLVGLTDATLQGDAGALAFTAACQQELPGTHFCSSEEVIRTASLPAGLSGSAWVLFSAVAGSGNGALFDASGIVGAGRSFSCNGWSDAGTPSSPNTALAVEFGSRMGAFSVQTCTEPRKVACCGWPSE